MLGTILLVILIVLLVGAAPGLGLQPYGWYPSGGLGLLVVVLLILVLMGRL